MPDSLVGYSELMRHWVDEALVPKDEKLNRRNAELLARFETEWAEARLQFSLSRQQEAEKFSKLMLQLLSRIGAPDFINMTVTQEQSVFFQLTYPEGLKGYVELHLEEPDEIELVFNLYRNKQVVKAYGGKVEESLAAYLYALNG